LRRVHISPKRPQFVDALTRVVIVLVALFLLVISRFECEAAATRWATHSGFKMEATDYDSEGSDYSFSHRTRLERLPDGVGPDARDHFVAAMLLVAVESFARRAHCRPTAYLRDETGTVAAVVTKELLNEARFLRKPPPSHPIFSDFLLESNETEHACFTAKAAAL